MKLITRRLHKIFRGAGILLFALSSIYVSAVTYDVTGGPPGTISPAGPNGEIAPPIAATTTGTQLADGDIINVGSLVTSANMATPSSSAIAYTIGVTNDDVGITVNVFDGSTLSYSGTSGTGAAIFTTRNDTTVTTSTYAIDGELSSGTGLYGIYLANSNGGAQDTHNINVSTTGSISGNILTNGVRNVNLNLTGDASVDGVINLATNASGLSTINVGSTGSATFTPSQAIDNIGLLHIGNNSTMNLGVDNSDIAAVTIDSGSTLNLTSALVGLASGDGNIINNGSMYLAANVEKTGTFGGTGTNFVTGGSSSGLSITTSNYRITNHSAVMVDINNYGNITLETANFNLNNGGANSFKVIYGSDGYTPGYLPGGTYTLVTTTAGSITNPTFATVPTSTLFLAFSNLETSDNTIQITLTRTPFNTYAATSLTQSIGSNLEIIGSSNPSSSMTNVLNAVEASTTGTSLEFALQQLAPLSNAPFYGYEIQNDSMYQVKLRLAALHDGSANYFAGDIGKDNHVWIRPFGVYANQDPKDDSFGYYGSTGGVVAGFDRNLDDRYLMGAAFAYAHSNVKEKINPISTTTIKSYIGMIYGTYNYTPTQYLDWVLALTANNFDSKRVININSTYTQTASSSYSSQQFSALGIWGQEYEAFGYLQLTPEAFAQYTFNKQYEYTETGAPGANLNISRTNSDVVTLGLGGIAAMPLLVDPSIIIPDIHGWAYYNPVIGKQNTIFSFLDGGGPIISFMNLSRVGLRIGAAFTIAVVDRLEVKFNFDYEVEDRYHGYMAYLNLRYFL